MDHLDWWHRLCTQKCKREEPVNCFKILYQWLSLFYERGIWGSENLSDFLKPWSQWQAKLKSQDHAIFKGTLLNTDGSICSPSKESIWRKGQEDGWDRVQMRKRQSTPSLYNLFPMVDELGNNFYLLTRFLCNYSLPLSCMPHKFCTEIHDVCKFLVLHDLFSFLVGRISLIKGMESPIWVVPLDRGDAQRQLR